MACEPYNRVKSYGSDTPFATIQDDIYNDGIGCINTNMPSCATQCTNLTKTSTACYSCLGQHSSCPSKDCLKRQVDCSSSPTDPCCTDELGSCCPKAQFAVECGSCIAANGQNRDAWVSCSTSSGLSSKTIIIIVVCCVVALVVVISIIVIVVKLRGQAKARQKLVNNLQKSKVDPRIIQNVANLDYSKIDKDIFYKADVQLALKSASKKVKSIPQPKNVAVTHLASESEGLFSLWFLSRHGFENKIKRLNSNTTLLDPCGQDVLLFRLNFFVAPKRLVLEIDRSQIGHLCRVQVLLVRGSEVVEEIEQENNLVTLERGNDFVDRRHRENGCVRIVTKCVW